MSSSGKWLLWVVLIASAVALVMFAPKRSEIGQIVVEPASWSPAAPAPETSKPAVQVRPDPSDTSTGPIVASDAVPPASAPVASRPPVEVEHAPGAASMARLEISFPSHAAIGGTIDILAGVAEGTAANRVEVVILYDPSALQLLSMGSGEPGRAEATIQLADNGRELGFAAFQFLIIALESKATVVTTAATAFDATGRAVKVIVPPPQEIALDRPPS